MFNIWLTRLLQLVSLFAAVFKNKHSKAKMRKFLTMLLFVAVAQLSAQETGSIVGNLTDKDFNNDPLAFANILIEGTTKGTTSDFDGLYEIADLEPGTYTVIYSFLGYETITQTDIIVEAGKSTKVDIGLSAASGVELEEFIGTGTTKKESEAALLLDQKSANIVKESIVELKSIKP